MADNTKKPSRDSCERINESGKSKTAALSGDLAFDRQRVKSSIEVKNAMPAPPNPNKDKGKK